jgi:hypothetical protein
MSYVFLHERPYRLEAMQNLFFQGVDWGSKENFWKLVASVWVDSENIWQNIEAWSEIFGFYGDEARAMMNEEELAEFQQLPMEFTVYRGTTRNEETEETGALSWTLDRDIAVWFSKRFSKAGKVLERKVRKEDVVALITRRSEKEIILFPPE